MSYSLDGAASKFGNRSRLARFADRLRLGTLGIAAIACQCVASAQVPETVIVAKFGFHNQTSATTLAPEAMALAVEVYLTDPAAAATKLTFQKPNGQSVALSRRSETVFAYYEYFDDEPQLTAAYPSGNYRLIVTGGGLDTTTDFAVTAAIGTPVRITNFAELQASGATAQPTWQAIPASGTMDGAALQLYSSGNVVLSNETLTSARLTTGSLNNLLPGETYTGALTYTSFQVITANNGQTDIVMGNAFTVMFPVFRGAATPAAPTAPTGAGAYASTPTQVTLTWQPPAGANPPTGYKIERATDATFRTDVLTYQLTYAATSFVDTRAVANTTYFYRFIATNAIGPSTPSAVVQVETPATAATGPTHFVNIATRAYCGVGNNVTIGGFVVAGTEPKKILVRAVGPSLTAQGVAASAALADPSMTLYAGSKVMGTNDNWQDNANASEISAAAKQIGAADLLNTDTKSSALLISLPPGAYTFVVTGKNDSAGIVLLEAYDADAAGPAANFVNIATRAYSTTGDGVTIGGFVIGGGAPKTVLLRAVGRTLASYGIPSADVLADPTIELHRGAPVIALNDNWISQGNANDILATSERIGAAPLANDDTQSAVLLLKLPPGVYTFIARGKAATSGIVLVEVYDAD